MLIFFSGCTLTEPKYDCSVKDGSVSIQNGLSKGAFLKLADKDKRTFKTLYIPANSNGVINGICNGRYYLYYELGNQWDPSSNSFKDETSLKKFDDPLDFKGDNYYEATLNPVTGGNAQTSNVDEEDFPK
jgi:hypothetical protein